MRINNNSKHVLKKLSKRYQKNNKLMNFFAISGIVLTCILFTCIFNVILSINDSIKSKMIDEIGFTDSGSFNYITLNQVEKLKQNKKIASSHLVCHLGFVEEEELENNFTTSLFYFSPEHFKNYKKLKIQNIVGKYPENYNEIMLSTTVLKQLKIEPIVGSEIELEILFQEQVLEIEFTLSGFFEYNKFEDVQDVFVSENFINTTDIYLDQPIYFLFVNFKQNINLIEKFADAVNENSYFDNDNEKINFTINPIYYKFIYLESEIIVILGLFILFIVLSGFLIIYNVFNISIINNIKFYGQLRTIGFTSKQIKRFIIKQGMYLTGIALPIGFFFGFLSSNIVLPIIIKITEIDIQIKFNIFIFIFSGLFTLITVYISLLTPMKHANKMSTMEAISINGVTIKRKCDISKKIHIYNLALINVIRNPKQFFIIIISLSIMPIILNLVITFVLGFHYDSYMSSFVSSDFVAAHVNYFKSEYNDSSLVDEDFIAYINTLDINEAGNIYCDKSYGRIFELDAFERVRKDIFYTQSNNYEYDIDLYGYDEFILSKFEVINGEINNDSLKMGSGIIEIIEVDDYNEPDLSSMRFKVGDHIDLYYNNQFVKEYEVIAQVKKITNFSELNGTLDYIATLALPSEEYLSIAPSPNKMSYIFNVPDIKLKEIHSKLLDFVENENESMSFKSKLEFENQFKESKNAFLVPGIFCAVIVGIIGIVNYINVFITSIINRKHEFVLLDKIGMTGSIRKILLIMEGVIYTTISSIIFIIISCIVNFSALKYIMDKLWLTKYQFNYFSLLICIPIYLIISVIVPIFIDNTVIKKCI